MTRRDDCDVCECNGKPFFNSMQQSQSQQSQSLVSNQQPPQLPTNQQSQPTSQLNSQQAQKMQIFGSQPMQIFPGQKVRTLSSQIMSSIFNEEQERESQKESNNTIAATFEFFPVSSCDVIYFFN